MPKSGGDNNNGDAEVGAHDEHSTGPAMWTKLRHNLSHLTKCLESVSDKLHQNSVPFQFSVLSGPSEATFEWTAIRAACRELSASCSLPDAALAGGSGSIQASSDTFFESLPCNLAPAAAVVLEDGVRACQDSIKIQVESKFKQVHKSLKDIYSEKESLRLVITGSFVYASLACKGITKKSPFEYIDVLHLRQCISRLLAVDHDLVTRAQTNQSGERAQLMASWATSEDQMTIERLAKDQVTVNPGPEPQT